MSPTPEAVVSEDGTRTRRGLVGLTLWMAIAALALWVGRDTPPAPTHSPEAEAVAQRKWAWISRDIAKFKRTRGDKTIPWGEAEGHLTIVIDDVGRELDAHQRLQGLRYPITFSVLPGSVYAAGAQLRLREDPRRYREIWLHLPMEPIDGTQMHEGYESEEEFLLVADSPDQWRAKISRALDRVPAAVGVNNHMGSRLSADSAAMEVVIDELVARKLLFLDSRTTAATVAGPLARARGLASAERKVFLDHDSDPAAMEAALAQAIELSRRFPTVAIGHPSRDLADVLDRGLDEAYESGVAVYPLSELIARDSDSANHAAPGIRQPQP